MAKIIRWDTPFTGKQFPSVGLLIDTKTDGTDILKAIVAPDGTDKYPKYLVDFGEVVAFTCMEEAHSPGRDFDSTMFEEENLCAYQYLESPWLRSYEVWVNFFAGGRFDSFFHYLLLGGDNNVEVITTNIPSIEIIEKSGVILIEYEV